MPSAARKTNTDYLDAPTLAFCSCVKQLCDSSRDFNQIYRFFFYCSINHRDLHSFPTRRSSDLARCCADAAGHRDFPDPGAELAMLLSRPPRSEEHTSELQSRPHLVCRLLLE